MNNAWLLIDGYNIVKPTGPPRRGADRWLHRERLLLLGRLAEHIPSAVRRRTVVVFDAKDPPSGVEDQFDHESMTVRFAVGYDEADDLIEAFIASHSAAKQLMVVTSDNRLQTAAIRRGASVTDSDRWIDALVDGDVRLAIDAAKYAPRGSIDANSDDFEGPPSTDQPTTEDWLSEFGYDE